jgi:hypothetical protein
MSKFETNLKSYNKKIYFFRNSSIEFFYLTRVIWTAALASKENKNK